jgi:release factor glutamine methyltransferase
METLWAQVGERSKGRPFAYVVGTKEFYGRPFLVDERVLVPRPETELLVDSVLELMHGENGVGRLAAAHGVVDLCTGSGVVGITLACEESGLKVCLTDIDARAIEVARLNAERLGVLSQLRFAVGDGFQALRHCPEHVPAGIVTANPPYVAYSEYEEVSPEVRAEPARALIGGQQGLAVIKRIVNEAPDYLAGAGWLCMEIGAGQQQAVHRLIRERGGFRRCRFRKDLLGIARVVCAQSL